jgi:hypothetical protein
MTSAPARMLSMGTDGTIAVPVTPARCPHTIDRRQLNETKLAAAVWRCRFPETPDT